MEEIVGSDVLKRNSSLIQRKRSTQASLTNTKSQSTKPGDEKENKKLIEVERAETGSVKLSVFVDYVKAAGLFMSLAALVFHCISTGTINNCQNI
jgi:hypothetical protein